MLKIQIGSPLLELFGESSAESPFVLLKCIVPTLLPEGNKKKLSYFHIHIYGG